MRHPKIALAASYLRNGLLEGCGAHLAELLQRDGTPQGRQSCPEGGQGEAARGDQHTSKRAQHQVLGHLTPRDILERRHCLTPELLLQGNTPC